MPTPDRPSDRALSRRSLTVGLAAAPIALAAPTAAPQAQAHPRRPDGTAPVSITLDGRPYPNPLRLRNGRAVTDARTWERRRRPELLQDFARHVYGAMLPAVKTRSRVQVTRFADGRVRKDLTLAVRGPYGTAEFGARMFLPAGRVRGTFVMIDHRRVATEDPDQDTEYLPVATILRSGHAIAVVDVEPVAPDDAERYRDGVIDAFCDPRRELRADQGRAIAAWAWAASRVLDHLRRDRDLDPRRIAVIGHSRSGKAALLAGATDPRFCGVVSNNSGSTGAKLARRGKGDDGTGEDVTKITSTFPHWFAETYAGYAGREESLPVDQHELLSLVAPRRLWVASATQDGNADPEGEFWSWLGSTPAYRLYRRGDTGLRDESWPPPTDVTVHASARSHHLRTGGHGLFAPDWARYLDGWLFD